MCISQNHSLYPVHNLESLRRQSQPAKSNGSGSVQRSTSANAAVTVFDDPPRHRNLVRAVGQAFPAHGTIREILFAPEFPISIRLSQQVELFEFKLFNDLQTLYSRSRRAAPTLKLER